MYSGTSKICKDEFFFKALLKKIRFNQNKYFEGNQFSRFISSSKFRRKKASLGIEDFILKFWKKKKKKNEFELHDIFWKLVKPCHEQLRKYILKKIKQKGKPWHWKLHPRVLKEEKIFFSTNLNVMNCFEKSSKPKRRSKIYRMLKLAFSLLTHCSLFILRKYISLFWSWVLMTRRWLDQSN